MSDALRRRWIAVRAISATAVLFAGASWAFASWWHLGFNYYGSWGAALTMGSVAVDVFDPPLLPPHRLGGHDVAVCHLQFFASEFDPIWWPSWHRSGPPVPLRSLVVPLWMPVIPLVGVAWTAHGRIRRIDRVGKCRKCGYDRKGLLPGAPCPECGAVTTGRA